MWIFRNFLKANKTFYNKNLNPTLGDHIIHF